MSLNISVQQAISWLNGKGDQNTILGIQQQGVLTFLENISYSFLASRSPYSGSLAGKGTLLWKIPHLVPVKAYSEGQTVGDTSTAAGKREVPNWDHIVSGEIVRRSGTFKNEYFDYRMADPAQAVATVNMIVGSLATSAAADTNAAFWTAVKQYFDMHPEQTMYMPNLVARKVLSDSEARELVVQLAHKRNDLTLRYNSKGYGVRPGEFNIVINGAGSINLAQTLIMLNQSVSAFEVAKAMINDPFEGGKANPQAVIGDKIIVDNMLDIAVGANVAWSEDTAYDCTGFYGSITHKDFIAFPVLEPSFGVREVPNNLNHNYIIEYARTHAFLRPELGCGITDFKAYAVGKELVEVSTGVYGYEVAIGGEIEVLSNKYFNNATALSVASGVTGITISGTKVTGVTAGTYDLTVTDGTASTVLKIKVPA